ncbi:MAG: redoxin domain-containing protein [Planctomycetes bacterium]|nr:redoxin domain-containing protein [Planctomycetota bacterium]
MDQIKSEQKENITLDNSKLGLAISSLVLGIVSFCMSFLVIGVIFGIVGLILGLASRKSVISIRSMAKWGVVLSIVGILLSIIFASYYYHSASAFFEEWEDSEDISYEEWIDETVPDFTFTDLAGNKQNISEFRGKKVILNFWATWCPPCVLEIPHFIELKKSMSDEELVIIGISDDERQKLGKFIKKHNINYIIGNSDDLPSPFYDIMSIPTTFFIDSNGIIRNVLKGYHDLEELKASTSSLDILPEVKTQNNVDGDG